MAVDDFYWNQKLRRFEDAAGTPISRDEIRKAIAAYIESVVSEAEEVTDALRKGQVSIATWELAMRDFIKESQGALGAIAGGGWSQVTPGQWGYIGSVVRDQYRYLAQWQRELEDMLPGELTLNSHRMAMYLRDALGTFENVLRRQDGDSGAIRRERRLLTMGVQHCESCIFYASLGWTPVGTLPGIGEECECLSNCLCYFETSEAA